MVGPRAAAAAAEANFGGCSFGWFTSSSSFFLVCLFVSDSDREKAELQNYKWTIADPTARGRRWAEPVLVQEKPESSEENISQTPV